jgi:hypothetical protein
MGSDKAQKRKRGCAALAIFLGLLPVVGIGYMVIRWTVWAPNADRLAEMHAARIADDLEAKRLSLSQLEAELPSGWTLERSMPRHRIGRDAAGRALIRLEFDLESRNPRFNPEPVGGVILAQAEDEELRRAVSGASAQIETHKMSWKSIEAHLSSHGLRFEDEGSDGVYLLSSPDFGNIACSWNRQVRFGWKDGEAIDVSVFTDQVCI